MSDDDQTSEPPAPGWWQAADGGWHPPAESEATDGEPSSDPAPKSSGCMSVALIIIGIFVVIAIGQAMFGDDDDTTATSGPAPTTGPLYVLYEVEGSTDWASITYETPTGTQQANPDVPVQMASGDRAGQRGILVGPFQPGDFVYISAQNKRESGSVTCRISTEDGVTISENSSSGGFSIATCQGTAG